MYEEYFRFNAAPFRLNPDPKFFFGSRSHNKAMAYLHYGLRQAEGFIVITGEIGAGKSILIGHLIDQLDRSNVVAAHLLTANLQPSALLSHILSAFRIEPAGSGKSAEIEAFEDFLFDQMNRGRRVLLIVDEAQNLPQKTIEELRMLSNMDYDGTPLFQVFLVGQPEFREILAKPDMEQFRQRIIASYHLEPLGAAETTEYIRHRLALVGWTDYPSISDDAFEEIFRATGGVPRKINKLCNRILLYGAIEKLSAVDAGVVKTVETDLKAENLERGAEESAAEELAENGARDKSEKKARAKARKAKPEREEESVEEVVEEPKRVAAAGGGGKRSPVVIPFGAIRKVAGNRKDEPAEQETMKSPRAADEASSVVSDGAHTAEPGAAAAEKASAPRSAGPLSVFDRLRTQRDVEDALAETENARAPATLIDVANAIAAASANAAARKERGLESDDDGVDDSKAAAVVAATKGWRQSMLRSLGETREELRRA
ncbi:MAG TPA: XrtA/PEP-CTERM system-associated ATPase, partial [Parvularculaceae bacterium]|nr:XrtA/PEP-CTERM system-associated ATPase [Parvularculaceae bacterium]